MNQTYLLIIFLIFQAVFLKAEKQFLFEHRLGHLSAEHVKTENFPFIKKSLKTIFLKNLEIQLNNDKILKSEQALLNLENQDINFTSLNRKVFLETSFSGSVPPFSLSAKRAFFKKQRPILTKALKDVIIFQDEVELKIAEKFIITADKAEYDKNRLILIADKNSCRFHSSDKTILSKKIFFDLKKGSLFLESVQGEIKNIPLKANESINLSSGKLTVLNQGKKILLQDGVKITHTGGAELICDALELDYNNKKIAKITTSDNAKVFFKTPALAIFTSLGPITIDLVQKIIFTAEKGIFYKEKDTLIVAKKAFLKFKDIKNLSDIENIVLEKEVHFFSSKFKNKNNLGLADRLRFDLMSKTLTLESFPKNKVIFWEESSALSLSANKIQIQKSGKNAVKGFGNVRLSLKKDEEKLFENTLHKYLLEK